MWYVPTTITPLISQATYEKLSPNCNRRVQVIFKGVDEALSIIQLSLSAFYFPTCSAQGLFLPVPASFCSSPWKGQENSGIYRVTHSLPSPRLPFFVAGSANRLWLKTFSLKNEVLSCCWPSARIQHLPDGALLKGPALPAGREYGCFKRLH